MKCHACNKSELVRKTKLQIFTYKGKSISLKQPGLWCDSCDEGVLDGGDIEKTESAFEAFKAKVDGILSPTEIRRIRKYVLKITQEEASNIFGGGKNAFSRYERGIVVPSLAVSNLLKEFDRHPEDVVYYIDDDEVAA